MSKERLFPSIVLFLADPSEEEEQDYTGWEEGDVILFPSEEEEEWLEH